MALEKAFTRVLRRLPAHDAIALASQKEKVIKLLDNELLAEGVLVTEEGGASARRRGVVTLPQKHFCASVGTEALADDLLSEPCSLNDLNTEEGPIRSDELLETALVVTDENVFVDGDVDKEDYLASNKAKEAAERTVDSGTQKDKSWRYLTPHSECLVVCSMGSVAEQMGAVAKVPSSDSDGDGMEKEIVEIPELLNRCKFKHVVSAAPFVVEGEGRLSPVWVDDDKVSFSKEFYLALLEDFLKQCRTPGALIWFTGHSQSGTGDWFFRDGTISFEEIFDLYQTHFKHRVLSIISDCSFSGNWVLRAVTALDKMGIPPCGHHTRECGTLIKVWVATEPDQKAEELHQVRHDVTITQDGYLTILQQFRTGASVRSFLNGTLMRCPSELSNCCSLSDFCAKLGWLGHVRSRPSLIYLVRGKDRGKPAWHYVLVDEGNVNSFNEQVASGTVDVAGYGKVLTSGWGKDPPDDVKNAIDNFFT